MNLMYLQYFEQLGKTLNSMAEKTSLGQAITDIKGKLEGTTIKNLKDTG